MNKILRKYKLYKFGKKYVKDFYKGLQDESQKKLIQAFINYCKINKIKLIDADLYGHLPGSNDNGAFETAEVRPEAVFDNMLKAIKK